MPRPSSDTALTILLLILCTLTGLLFLYSVRDSRCIVSHNGIVNCTSL